MANALERVVARSLPLLPQSWLQRLAGGVPVEIRGRRLDPHIHLIARAAARKPRFHELSPVEARRAMGEAVASGNGRPNPMQRLERRVLSGPAGDIPVRVYHPAGLAGPRPLLLYFHQGGGVIGDLDWCEPFCTRLADIARCVVLAVDYRLGPEHRFPAAHDDAWAAYQWALEHADQVGGDPERLVVGGDSMGGNLSAFLAQEAKRRGAQQPLLQLLVYPWLVARADTASYRDFGDAYPVDARGMDWFRAHLLSGPHEYGDPRISPGLAGELSGLCPALVVTAGFDPLCDEGEAYAQALEEAGVPVAYRCYESLCHSFTALGGAVPAALAAQEEIARDVERALAGAPPVQV